MADDERRTSKRSRFDQTESDVRRSSRFDRDSRSPVSRYAYTRQRSRSPIAPTSTSTTNEEKRSPAVDPAAAAAAAAARINASIQAKKGIQHVDVPPIRTTASPVGKVSSPGVSGSSTSNINGDMYIADGDYIKDIEVNDLRNRYTLTKGATQKMIKDETGAGTLNLTQTYFEEEKLMSVKMSRHAETITLIRVWLPLRPPLYLHITSTTKEGLEKAVQRVEELMKQELPNLVDERRFRRREPEQVERDEYGRRKWPEERIPIDLDPIPGFNLRAQVVGHQGAYVKHIQQETRCRVQIKGRNSGFMEHGTGRESDEPMYLHVAGPDPREVIHAKELCEDLLANVKEQYERFKENSPQQTRGYSSTPYQPSDRQSYGPPGSSYGGYGGQQPATQTTAAIQSPPGIAGAPGAPGAGSPVDYGAQYAQYYGGQDPYSAYGGYQAYCAMYQQFYQQSQSTAPGAPPPGPPSEQPPPPPPPSGPPPSGSPPSANGSYNNVSMFRPSQS